MEEKLAPIHPGEILKEEFLEPFELSANKLALELKISTNRITEIIKGRRAITADTALRLAKFFGTSAELWLNLQKQYELQLAEDKIGEELKKILDFSSP